MIIIVKVKQKNDTQTVEFITYKGLAPTQRHIIFVKLILHILTNNTRFSREKK